MCRRRVLLLGGPLQARNDSCKDMGEWVLGVPGLSFLMVPGTTFHTHTRSRHGGMIDTADTGEGIGGKGKGGRDRGAWGRDIGWPYQEIIEIGPSYIPSPRPQG